MINEKKESMIGNGKEMDSCNIDLVYVKMLSDEQEINRQNIGRLGSEKYRL